MTKRVFLTRIKGAWRAAALPGLGKRPAEIDPRFKVSADWRQGCADERQAATPGHSRVLGRLGAMKNSNEELMALRDLSAQLETASDILQGMRELLAASPDGSRISTRQVRALLETPADMVMQAHELARLMSAPA